MAGLHHLWDSRSPQTVRQVHAALSARRRLAYTTVMTVLHRLARKDLVVQICDQRAYQYAPAQDREERAAGLMAEALDQLADTGMRSRALMRLAERVGVEEAESLGRALAMVGSHLSGVRRQLDARTLQGGPCPAF
jgi:predicted transcriptional regulator